MAGALANKTALVTGASRGIGRTIARQLAAEGALVAVNYAKNRAAADETLRLIESEGGRAFALQADLQSVAEVRRLFAELDAELTRRTGSKGLDILVSNAGDDANVGFAGVSEEVFDHVFSLNTKGPFFLFQEALGRLRDHGRVINISSIVARGAQPDRPAYAASKAATNSLVLSLAAELGPRGIAVNTVAPGATITELSAPILDDPAQATLIKASTAMGRFASTDDVANVVSLLVSDRGGWVTGQVIEATGGMAL